MTLSVICGAVNYAHRAGRVAALAILLCFFTGCTSDNNPVDSSSTAETSTAQEELERCEKKLAAALQRLSPEAMSTTNRKDSVVNALNSWLTSCGSNESSGMKVSDANASMLSATAQRFATAARYTENDTTYVRDCLMLRSMSESIWKQADSATPGAIASDRDRVVRLFADVVRNVGLMNKDEQRVPVGLYEVLLTGRGTVDDRIWVFAEALRQRQIDAFVIRPSSEVANDATGGLLETVNMLVAVAVEPGVFLFDPISGTPVPRAGDSSILVSEPAGLSDLKSFERWTSPRVELVAQPAAFSPRMLLLQEHLPAEESAVLYEELKGGSSEIQPLVERVVSSGNGAWSQEDISIWSYPETRAVAAGALSEEQSAAYVALLRPYDAPFERDPLKSSDLFDEIDVNQEQLTEEEKMARRMQLLEERWKRINESSEELFGRASKRLLKTRLEQIMGAVDVSMIQQLQQIRIASMQVTVEVEVPVGDNKAAVMPFRLPDSILRVHRNATGDSLYWTSLCQVARGDHGASVTTFRNYRRQYPDDRWKYGSMINEAIALIQIGDNATARAVLSEADTEDNPERIRTQWLLSRLASPPAEAPGANGDARADSTVGADSLKPDETKPAGDAPAGEEATAE